MPENGLIWRADARRWKFSLDGTGSHSGLGTGSYGGSASAAVYFTPDVVNEAAFFSLTMGVDIDAGTSSVTYYGPGSPFGTTWTGGVPLVVEIVLEGDEVYNIGGNWFQNGVVKVYVGGALKLSASVAGTVSGGLGPHYLMYGGEEVYASLDAPTASTTGLPGTMPDTYSFSSSADVSLTVWCEWQEPGSGVWTGSPVTFHSSTAPAVPGSCTDPGLGTVMGATTSGLILATHAEQSTTRSEYATGTITQCCLDVTCNGVNVFHQCQNQPSPVPWKIYKQVTESKQTSVAAGLIADRDRAVKRVAPGTKFLMYRTEMPETQYAGSSSCNDNGVTTSSSNGGTVHPHQAEILQVVSDSAAAMEDTFSYRAYSEKSTSGGWSKTVTYETTTLGAILCPSAPADPCTDPGDVVDYIYTEVGLTPQPPNESYSSGRSYTFPSYVGPTVDMAGYLGHAQPRPRYINSWCNPHWSFFLWFEPWKVDGSPEAVEAYWLPERQQHLDNAGLPSPPKSRNHLIADGLANDTGMRAFYDAFTGGLPPVGISRFQVKNVTPLTDFTYGSSSETLWSASQGELTFVDAGVIVTPSA